MGVSHKLTELKCSMPNLQQDIYELTFVRFRVNRDRKLAEIIVTYNPSQARHFHSSVCLHYLTLAALVTVIKQSFLVRGRHRWFLFIYNRPKRDGCRGCPIVLEVGTCGPMMLYRGRALFDVSSCMLHLIILLIPWTDLFVVEQDGVPSRKSLHYSSGTLHWYVIINVGQFLIV